MSYILEALKKAEAERQLGATPTLHAPTLEAAAPRAGGVRKPLLAAVGGMAVVIVVLAVVVWRQASEPASAPPPATAAVPAPAVQMPRPAPPVSVAAAAPVTPAPPPAPVVAAAPVAAPPPAPPTRPEPVNPPPAPVAAVPAPAPAAKPAEEPVQSLHDLPEPIRRAIPTYTMDGYMYSPNPTDRMILIDKVLRREGEEVAPGLVLEKLLPKGAVFSFRGYRYRVAF